ncbi:MAG: cobalt ECF transporter T component CbiQ [Magnetococcales bacterium]|nr:cobalt ECF transporter T component CbiQ [Magnetococcales bacterium]MBF0151000.1 cobalt ECF transporter T component CbiQ [Magnetococcales bacterium]MBF0172698.1 cobalt ECF transporter T component CbiQ [Magnetococcales bacterium]MBF0347889.1 cobalt ECF transporter T component CbiQ [Magnetococcales bacterium]MBF0629412.1 cobalt ECF transporter T component CbiQ [Magnetococcales bacterium]
MTAIDRVAHCNRWRHRSLTEKVVFALGMLLLSVVFPPYPVAVIVLMVTMAATLFGAGIPVRVWLACIIGPVGFLFTGAMFLAIQIDSSGVSLAPEGLFIAGNMMTRALAGFACFLFLALTTPTTDLLAGLRRSGVPPEIVEIALLMYRFIFLLADTSRSMSRAQASRLGHSSKWQQLRSLGLLVANLLPRAMDQGRRLEVGLAARGWTGNMRVLSRTVPLSIPTLILVIVIELVIAAAGVHFS